MRIRLSFVLLTLLAGCVSTPAPPPPQPPRPTPTPAPPPPPPPAPVLRGDWQDWPASPGAWVYRQDSRGSLALFGAPDTGAQFMVRCDRAAQRVYLSRAGAVTAGSGPMTIRTSAQTSSHIVRNTGGQPPYVALDVPPRDPLLDRMAFSRGRFVVEVTGLPILVVPAWPELSRVVEDCRG
ncbi:hypothetical protein FHS96_000659 [Sphingomonas zeicaulis]|uniref:hypothetical protein n=1 Tax=Sphingomonas zeicaulis TaxID=1632740 RepID=UPI003D1C732A